MRRRKKIKLDYSRKKYNNPFFQNRKNKKNNYEYIFPWKSLFIVTLILCLPAIFLWFFYYSSFFKISKVEASTTSKIPKDEITAIIWQQTENKIYLFGKQNNFFLFDTDLLNKNLINKYPLNEPQIKKKFPNKITVSIKEKNYSIIWREADKYYYVSRDCASLETDPLMIKDIKLPIIENNAAARIQDNKLSDCSGLMDKILELNGKFLNEPKIQINKFTLEDDSNSSIKIITKGPALIFNLNENFDRQISKLYAIMNERLKEDFNKKSYIDLRYGDKIYYK